MSNSPQDQTVRQQALTIDQSFIIQAPAGSGKTALLIKRVLRLLAIVDQPEEIVAITFTRKAAAEMRVRLFSTLHQANNKIEAVDQHTKELMELANAVLKRDQEKQWHILLNNHRLRIQTIDSLSASLTKQMPLLSNLGAQPEIIEDAKILYELAADQTLAELEGNSDWSAVIAALLMHLDNDLPRVKRLLVSMLMKRDQWMSYVTHDHDKQFMEEAVRQLIEKQLVIIKQSIPSDLSETLMKILLFAADNLQETNPEHIIASCETRHGFPGPTIDQLPVWRAIVELCLTSQDQWRKRLDKNIGFPAASEKQISVEVKAIREEMKLSMQSLLQEMQKKEGLLNSLKLIRILPTGEYSTDEWNVVKSLCDLLKLSAAQLDLVFAERNQIDFIGIATKAVLALGKDDSPTDLAHHLDYQIKHLLIDEFQDVSVSQARLVKALTREWSMDDGRTLFLVGDPMQSIYRFREAEVSIFMHACHSQSFGNIPLIPLKLSVNFRSKQSLVNWFNNSFAIAFPNHDDLTDGAVSYSSSEAFDNNLNYEDSVKVYPFYNKQYEREAEQVCTLIEEIQSISPQDSIAILVRSRSHLVNIVSALRAHQLSFRAIDIEKLNTQSVIQDLMSLTRALLFPADRTAWLSCLRAPWCGLSLESLHHLCHDNPERLISNLLTDTFIMQGLKPTERQRAEHFHQYILQASIERETSGLSIAIESLWCRLGGPATLKNDTDLKNSEAFFELLQKIENAGSIDRIEDLFNSVEQLYAVPDEATLQQIHVMTIHKAKGLEFDHVILPGLGRQTRNKTDELLAWLLSENNNTEDLILAPIKQTGKIASDLYHYINYIEKQKQHFEDLRLLYVATTRARKSLHLFGHVKLKEEANEITCLPDRRSLLNYLWSDLQEKYTKHKPTNMVNDFSEENTVIHQDNYRLNEKWQLPEIQPLIINHDIQTEIKHASDIEYDWAGETIKHIGSVTHQIIQQIAETGVDNNNEVSLQKFDNRINFLLTRLGVNEEELSWAVSQVQLAIKNMLNDEQGLWILSSDHKEVFNEYALSGIHEGKIVNVIMDRTFVDSQNRRWIIDYKTSRHEGADKETFLQHEKERYQEQLNLYGQIMSYMDDRPIMLALYFPLLKGWQQWKYRA